MSINYAAGLSAYENKGKCGLPEIFDSGSELELKIKKLAELIRNSRCLVVHTGAGISTAAGLPDFRGPNGVWTLEKRGLDPNNFTCTTFDDAMPTFSHLALTALERNGYVKFLITQNVDGLHVRSGFPVDRLAELHGNIFVEKCPTCHKKYYRENASSTVGLKSTGNYCKNQKNPNGRLCRGILHDNVLDWEDALPEVDLELANHYSRIADLNLCLGTTLQIVPAGNLPLLCRRKGGKLVTVNLQKTKHHGKTDYVIHCKVDFLMNALLDLLNIPHPETKLHIPSVFFSTNEPVHLHLDKTKVARKRKYTRISDDDVNHDGCAKF